MRKSERIDVAHDSLPTGSNPATVVTVPRPIARFAAKGQSQNLGIVLADIGNDTTTASRVRGVDELEDIEFYNGAAAARSSQYGLALWLEKQNTKNGTWSLGRTQTWCVKARRSGCFW